MKNNKNWLEFYNNSLQQGGWLNYLKTENNFNNYYKSIPEEKNDTSNYNLREYFNRNQSGAYNFSRDLNAHAPDSFKLPNHPTFSDESIYFNSSNKDQAGHWVDNMYIPYNPKVKDTIIEKKQQGGAIALTHQQKQQGLNNSSQEVMFFPNIGPQVFRGLDNGQPIKIQDEQGKTKILKGPKDQEVFFGNVQEKKMQTGGKLPPIYVDSPNDPRYKRYQDSLSAYKQSPYLSPEEEAIKHPLLKIKQGIPHTSDFGDNPAHYTEIEHFMKFQQKHPNIKPNAYSYMEALSGNDYPNNESPWLPVYKNPVQPVKIGQAPQHLQQIPNVSTSNPTTQQGQIPYSQVPEPNMNPVNYQDASQWLNSGTQSPNWYSDEMQQGGDPNQEQPNNWLEQGEQPISLPTPRFRQYKGRIQKKVNRSTYEPHPKVPRLQEGGKTNNWLNNYKLK